MNENIETIFATARELEAQDRVRYLDDACGDDTELRNQIESLLAADKDAGSFLMSVEHAPGEPFPAMIKGGGDKLPSEAAGQVIGRYKLLEIIGEGGFGTVWMAEQREPVKRKVALKIVKLGMDTKQIVARFEVERQALAMMDHPNIARVFDAGSTETGRPYFVMELVKGRSILEYADSAQLDTKARLGLFSLVCNAIQHAHQKGIIHRDIKPGNVLVTMHDGVPVPKVIDFGIAKAINQELTQKTLFTEYHHLIGTPVYMSPEQAEMSGLDIDTRSDVYSLGVLLYELLTGTPPFAHKELMERGFGEMMRIIREDTPHKPSTRLSTLGESSAITAEQRHTDIKKLGLVLRGDLDWIVMKCLEKDRTRRYETAIGLSEDIVRHLNDEPVIAGPPSQSYKLSKFVKRNRGRVIAACLVSAVLVLGVAGTSYGMIWAMHERDIAVAAQTETVSRAQELQVVSDFQSEQLGNIDPEMMGIMVRRAILDATPTPQRTQIEQDLFDVNFTNIAMSTLEETIFKHTIEAIDHQFSDMPLLQAQMLQSLCLTLLELGLHDLAVDPQARALEIRRSILSNDDPRTLESITSMGVILRAQGSLTQAEPFYREALDAKRRVLGDDHPDTMISINNMGILQRAQGKLSESEPYYLEALERRRRVLGNDHPDTLISISSMGALSRSLGKLDEAEIYTLEALKGRRRVLGVDHQETLNSINNMGAMRYTQGKFAEAETYLREAVLGSRRTLGDDHPRTLKSINNLGTVLNTQGKLAEAEPFYKEALEGRRRLLGAEHPSLLTSINNMGALLQAQGKLVEAETFFIEALSGSRKVLGNDHPDTLISINRMGSILQAQNKSDEAEPYYREALDGYRRVLGDNHVQTVITINNYAYFLIDLDRYAQALDILRSSVLNARNIWANDSGALGNYLMKIGFSEYKVQGFAQAETTLLEAYQLVNDGFGPDHAKTKTCITYLADLYTALHDIKPNKGYEIKAQEWRGKQ